MLSPILHPASGLWMLGKIENHTARPLSRTEIEAHIAEVDQLRAEITKLNARNFELSKGIADLPGRIADEMDRRGLLRRSPTGETGPG